jgi:hypothetical protein
MKKPFKQFIENTSTDITVQYKIGQDVETVRGIGKIIHVSDNSVYTISLPFGGMFKATASEIHPISINENKEVLTEISRELVDKYLAGIWKDKPHDLQKALNRYKGTLRADDRVHTDELNKIVAKLKQNESPTISKIEETFGLMVIDAIERSKSLSLMESVFGSSWKDILYMSAIGKVR